MSFGIVGLGRMGLSLGKLAVERGPEVVAGDPEDSAREQAEKAEMLPVVNLEDVPGESRPKPIPDTMDSPMWVTSPRMTADIIGMSEPRKIVEMARNGATGGLPWFSACCMFATITRSRRTGRRRRLRVTAAPRSNGANTWWREAASSVRWVSVSVMAGVPLGARHQCTAALLSGRFRSASFRCTRL